MNKKTIWIVIGVIIVVGLVFGITKNKNINNDGSIKIGAAMGLSGVCADFGEGELKAIRLAIDEVNQNNGINGKKINLIVEDTMCDNKGTANAIQKLIEVNKVEAILGPTWGDSLQSGFAISQKAKIVSVSPSTAMETLEFTKRPIDYVFSTWFPQRTEIQFLQDYAKKKSIRDFVVIYDNDPFAEMMAELFKTEATKNGLKVDYAEKTSVWSEDYRTIITKIKAYPESSVFISFFSPDTKARFLKQFKDLGMKNMVFSSADIENQTLLDSFPSVLDGVIFASAKITGKNNDFINKHNLKYGINPQGAAAGQAYDATMILIEALKKAPVSDLNQTLLRVSVSGVTAEQINFNGKHQITGGGYVLKTIKNGQFVEIK